MQIAINADIFVRFANLARNLPADDERKYLRSVLVEVAQGNVFIFATDSRFAAVAKIGESLGEFRACITADDVLTNQANAEKPFASSVFVSAEKVSTSLGFVYPGNPFVEAPQGKINEAFSWRQLFTVMHDKNHRNMFIDTERMRFMHACSPSGKIIFPNKIDTGKPIVVKDSIDDNWLGVFLARPNIGNQLFGNLPEWINV